jgi:hypothetical protein
VIKEYTRVLKEEVSRNLGSQSPFLATLIDKVTHGCELHAVAPQYQTDDLVLRRAACVSAGNHFAQQRQSIPIYFRGASILVTGLLWYRISAANGIAHPSPAVAIHDQ